MSDLISRDALYQALHEAGGCDAEKGSWAAGWDSAIDEAIRLLDEQIVVGSTNEDEEFIIASVDEEGKFHIPYASVVYETEDEFNFMKKAMQEKKDKVYCRECAMHGRCAIEGIYTIAKIGESKRFCPAGERVAEREGTEYEAVQKWSDEHQLPEKKKRVQRGVAVIREREKECIVELEREVDPDNAMVLNGGSVYGGGSNYYSYSWDAQIELIDSKHIRATRAYSSSIPCSVAWQVVELG